MKVGASIFGGIKAAKAMRQQKRAIQGQMRENQAWYDRNYNADYTQRADAQRLLTMTQDSIRARNRNAQGAAVVGGATSEAIAQQKAANNATMGNVASSIAAAAENQKAAVEDKYMARKDAYQKELNALTQQQAQNTINAVNGVADAANSIGGGLNDVLGGFGKKGGA